MTASRLSLPPRLRALLQPSAAPVLVLDAGPKGMQASLWTADDAQPLWVAHDTGLDPTEALPALLQRLRESGHKPREAAVILAGAVLASVDLPVDPQRPRPVQQMLEMARYEAEPAVAAHNGMWMIGEVLAARESLSTEARDQIVRAMNQGGYNEHGDPLRFGELGVSMARVERVELDAALQAQHALQILDGDLACAWHGELLRDVHGHRTAHWRVAAMSQSLRARWLTAARDNGLRLSGFWPRGGLAVWRHASPTGTTLAVEIWPEQFVLMRMVDGRVATLRSEPRQGQNVDPSLVVDLLADWQAEPIGELLLGVADPTVQAEALAAALQRLSRLPARVVAADPQAMGTQRAMTVAGQARLPAPRRATLAMGLSDPRAPIWRRPEWRPWLILAGVMAAVMTWQALAWWQIQSLRRESDRAEADMRRRASSAQDTQALDNEAMQLDREAATLRQDLAAVMARNEGMALVDQRMRTVPALIRALGQAIDQRVVLDAIVESNDPDIALGVEVRAWSPEAALLQDYAARVAKNVSALGLTAAQGEVSASRGRLGTPGYQIRFWLVPESAELAGGDAALASTATASAAALVAPASGASAAGARP